MALILNFSIGTLFGIYLFYFSTLSSLSLSLYIHPRPAGQPTGAPIDGAPPHKTGTPLNGAPTGHIVCVWDSPSPSHAETRFEIVFLDFCGLQL